MERTHTADGAGKVMPMREAVAAFVHDGATVGIEGFTHLIPTA
ncbi:CoA transferase subunit A, partial [Streptomyces sp. SID5910]|nr:CoA transferase subunit A [Streptomyces sp. SID5910]